MAKELLGLYNNAGLSRLSDDIGQVYEWSKNIIGKIESSGRIATLATDMTNPEERQAARIRKQKEIFSIKEARIRQFGAKYHTKK